MGRILNNADHKEIRVFTPTGMLGYGYTMTAFNAGMRREPHVVSIDAGSTDAGPFKLGQGVASVSRQATKKDLLHILIETKRHNIPVIIGSAGGAGAAPNVQWTIGIVQEIAKECKLHFRITVIWADVEKSYLKEKMINKKIMPLGPVGPLTEENVDKSNYIVAQMGIEPYLAALEEGPEVIIAGRSFDPVMTACLCVKNGFDTGLALHMGKILECGALCAIPASGGDSIMGYLRGDHFVVEPLNPLRKCTKTSVAAHTLYEKPHPYILHGPGGHLDLSESFFEEISDTAVKVTGSRFFPSENYTLKLEGAGLVGYRTFCLAGIRDQIFIRALDESLEYTRNRLIEYFSEISFDEYELQFRLYGHNAVLGEKEPLIDQPIHEIGLVIDVVAKSQEIADMLCSFARATLLHYDYTGRIGTAGNLAFPYSPSDVSSGSVYQFTIHHLMEVDDPCELFSVETFEI